MTYELWCFESRNLVDWYDTLAELRAALRAMPTMAGLMLAVRNRRGKTTWVDPGAFYHLSS